MKTLFALAFKLLIRDARRGELLILALSLLVAVSATTAIDLLADRLDRTMTQAAAEFMGGDLALSGHQPLALSILEEASRRGLESAETTEFSSMLVEQDELLLAGVKAIPDHYPLRGTFKIKETLDGSPVETRAIPGPREVWVEAAVLSALHLKLGDTLTVGEASFRIRRILAYEPDRRGDIYSLSPRILINAKDLEATHIVQPGSHVHRIAVFNGTPEALKAFKYWLKPQLGPDQHLNDLDEDRPELGKAMSKAQQYLGLSSVAVVLLAGVAIAMSTRRHLRRHYDLIAILKCHGATSRDILVLAVFEYLMIGIVVSLPAAGLGWLLESLLVTLMRPLLPGTLMDPGQGAFLLGIGSGLLILFGFSLPIIQRLRRLPPLRVLRRELEPAGSPWPIYLTATATVGWLLSRHSDSWWMVLGVFVGAGVLCLVMGGLAYIGLIATRRLIPSMPLAARLGFQHLCRTPLLTVTQVLVFSITLIALELILVIRTELINDWQQQLPLTAPNHFALNLFDADLPGFKDFMTASGMTPSPLYPVIRGRLTKINEDPALDRARKDPRAEASINRELSLTAVDLLPPDNRIVEGQWPDDGPEPGVSVEQALAGRLGLHLGDQLTFDIAGEPLTARVNSLRALEWDRMTPNFYMIFSGGRLDAFPRTWLTSFHLDPTQDEVKRALAKRFPAVTLLDVSKLLEQLNVILQQLSKAIEIILCLALLAGVAVLLATVRATSDERIHEDTLLRVIGARKRLLRRAQVIEFGALGLMCGLFSALTTELVVFYLATSVMDLPYHFHGVFFLATPLGGALLIAAAGFLSTRKITEVSPMSLLRSL